jgi:ABC-type dipeptide/oligopeptide/nickel transport system ATPase component
MTAAVAPLLRARDVTAHLKVDGRIVRAVDGVDVDVFPGECVGILGQSGSGKSTFARVVTRLLPNLPMERLSGAVMFDGQDVMRLSEPTLRQLRRRRSFAMVFQDPLGHLNPTRRIEAQMLEALRLIAERRAARQRAAALLEMVGLDDPEQVLRAYPHQLSGGMRQRVLIAMALAPEPRLLIADEPTTALDATVQIQVIDTLRRITRERHMAMLVITHNLGLVAELCDRVYVMYAGRFVENADVFTLFERPQHPHTIDLIHAGRQLLQPRFGACDVSA